jgi:hypothetical protein
MALPAGFPPASFRLEGGCLMYSTTAAFENWSARQELHLRSLGPKPSALATRLRAEKWRTRRALHPQPSRRQRVAPLIELRVREMVGSAGNAPVVASDRFNDARFTAGWSEHLPENGSGGGSCTHGDRAYEARLNLILPAVKWWSRWVTLPHELDCRASALLVCHDPEIGRLPPCRPE